jgi:hypothetical protein
MHTHYDYSIEELEDMIPFELGVYVDLTKEFQKKMEEARNG